MLKNRSNLLQNCLLHSRVLLLILLHWIYSWTINPGKPNLLLYLLTSSLLVPCWCPIKHIVYFLGSCSLAFPFFASFIFCRFVFVFTEGVGHVKDGLDVNAAACGRWLSVAKWQQRFHLNLMMLMTKYIYESFTFLYSVSSRLRQKNHAGQRNFCVQKTVFKSFSVSSLFILGLQHRKYLHHYYHLYSRLDCSV